MVVRGCCCREYDEAVEEQDIILKSQSLIHDSIPVPQYGKSRSKISCAGVIPYDGHDICDVAKQISDTTATDVICSSLFVGRSVDVISTSNFGRVLL